MSDIIRTAYVTAVDTEGNPVDKPRRCRALIDTGATATVIPRRVAIRLGGTSIAEGYSHLEGEPVASKVVRLRVSGAGCQTQVVVAMVSDKHAARAGAGASMIVGHDYLQRSLARLRYDTDPHGMDCSSVLLRRRRRGSR